MISRMVRAELTLREARRDLILGRDFLLANTSMEVVLGMLFFPFSNADMGLQRACLKELYNAKTMPFDQHQVIKLIRLSSLSVYQVRLVFLEVIY